MAAYVIITADEARELTGLEPEQIEALWYGCESFTRTIGDGQPEVCVKVPTELVAGES